MWAKWAYADCQQAVMIFKNGIGVCCERWMDLGASSDLKLTRVSYLISSLHQVTATSYLT